MKSDFLPNCIIAILIIFICYLLMCQIIPAGIEKRNCLMEKQQNNSTTLEYRMANYNIGMSDNEKEFREYHGLGTESIGDNYNSMG